MDKETLVIANELDTEINNTKNYVSKANASIKEYEKNPDDSALWFKASNGSTLEVCYVDTLQILKNAVSAAENNVKKLEAQFLKLK